MSLMETARYHKVKEYYDFQHEASNSLPSDKRLQPLFPVILFKSQRTDESIWMGSTCKQRSTLKNIENSLEHYMLCLTCNFIDSILITIYTCFRRIKIFKKKNNFINHIVRVNQQLPVVNAWDMCTPYHIQPEKQYIGFCENSNCSRPTYRYVDS